MIRSHMSWSRSAVVFILMAVVGPLLLVAELNQDHGSLEDAVHRRDATALSINEYLRLASAQQDTLHGSKPQDDVEDRMTQAIEFAKISPRPRFRATVQADRAFGQKGIKSGGAGRLREQTVSIQVPGLTVEQIGRVLVYWRDQQHVWIPNNIELIHDQRSNTSRYTLQLDCVAVYYTDGDE